jgi:hypothetical protein
VVQPSLLVEGEGTLSAVAEVPLACRIRAGTPAGDSEATPTIEMNLREDECLSGDDVVFNRVLDQFGGALGA